MPQNIYIVGAQCTGKTTLVMALKDHFEQHYPTDQNPLVLAEVARSVLKQHSFTASDITSSKTRALELQTLIIEAQYVAEKAIGTRWFMSDRSGFDPVIYAMRHVGEREARGLKGLDHWKELRTGMEKGLVVICEAGADWLIDDGVRLMPKDKADWIAFHRMFCQALDDAGLKYVILPYAVRDLQARVNFVINQLREDARRGEMKSESG